MSIKPNAGREPGIRSYGCEIASYDEANATRNKLDSVIEYPKMKDDNQNSPGAIQCMDNFKQKANDVLDAINGSGGLKSCYTELIGMYDSFTNFEEEINSYTTAAERAVGYVNEYMDQALVKLREKLNEMAKDDASLIDDINELNRIIGDVAYDETQSGEILS